LLRQRLGPPQETEGIYVLGLLQNLFFLFKKMTEFLFLFAEGVCLGRLRICKQMAVCVCVRECRARALRFLQKLSGARN
jgi:hypothetical protein